MTHTRPRRGVVLLSTAARETSPHIMTQLFEHHDTWTTDTIIWLLPLINGDNKTATSHITTFEHHKSRHLINGYYMIAAACRWQQQECDITHYDIWTSRITTIEQWILFDCHRSLTVTRMMQYHDILTHYDWTTRFYYLTAHPLLAVTSRRQHYDIWTSRHLNNGYYLMPQLVDGDEQYTMHTWMHIHCLSLVDGDK